MRTFIGIEFDSELKSKFTQLQDSLRSLTIKGRWKHPDNFHLTLKFLGEVEPSEIKRIVEFLEELGGFGSFRLKPGKLGQFKGKDNIRVLWLGLEGDTDRLLALQKKVDSAMEKLGFAKEARSYKPHITLAQDLVVNHDFQLLQQKAAYFVFPEVNVDKIHLFSSEQIAGRRVYTSIAKFFL